MMIDRFARSRRIRSEMAWLRFIAVMNAGLALVSAAAGWPILVAVSTVVTLTVLRLHLARRIELGRIRR